MEFNVQEYEHPFRQWFTSIRWPKRTKRILQTRSCDYVTSNLDVCGEKENLNVKVWKICRDCGWILKFAKTFKQCPNALKIKLDITQLLLSNVALAFFSHDQSLGHELNLSLNIADHHIYAEHHNHSLRTRQLKKIEWQVNETFIAFGKILDRIRRASEHIYLIRVVPCALIVWLQQLFVL